MKIKFTKMQGAGNDFVVLDQTADADRPSPEQIRFLADRHFGVGADQVLCVRPAPSADLDFEYVIYNADGGEVEQCGNGARCFVRYVREKGLTAKDAVKVKVVGGVLELRQNPDGARMEATYHDTLARIDAALGRMEDAYMQFEAALDTYVGVRDETLFPAGRAHEYAVWAEAGALVADAFGRDLLDRCVRLEDVADDLFGNPGLPGSRRGHDQAIRALDSLQGFELKGVGSKRGGGGSADLREDLVEFSVDFRLEDDRMMHFSLLGDFLSESSSG